MTRNNSFSSQKAVFLCGTENGCVGMYLGAQKSPLKVVAVAVERFLTIRFPFKKVCHRCFHTLPKAQRTRGLSAVMKVT